MSNNAEPIVGNWYEYPEEGEKFEVLEVDEDRGVVEIQYADGERDEIDLEEWIDLEVDLTDPPEDWAEPPDPGVEAPIKDAEEVAWAGRPRRARRVPDDEKDGEEDEPDDFADDDSWRDEG
jgi:hypothetical protein